MKNVIHSYSGTDIRVYASVSPDFYDAFRAKKERLAAEGYEVSDNGNITLVELGSVQTLSYSVYRGKEAVKVLGKAGAKGFTRGDLTVAGTIIFTVLHERVLTEVMSLSPSDSADESEMDLSLLRIDQLPPLDIFISFENEFGNKSRLGIIGAEFMNEGQVHSINDLITENSVNYLAKHISPMRTANNTLAEEVYKVTQKGEFVSEDDLSRAKQEIRAQQKRFL